MSWLSYFCDIFSCLDTLGGIGRGQRISRELHRWLSFLSVSRCIPSFWCLSGTPSAGVSRPTSLPLGVPRQSLSGGIQHRFYQGYAQSISIFFVRFGLYLLCPRPQVLLVILSGRWIFRILLMHPFVKVSTCVCAGCGICCSPGLSSIEQDWFYIWRLDSYRCVLLYLLCHEDFRFLFYFLLLQFSLPSRWRGGTGMGVTGSPV